MLKKKQKPIKDTDLLSRQEIFSQPWYLFYTRKSHEISTYQRSETWWCLRKLKPKWQTFERRCEVSCFRTRRNMFSKQSLPVRKRQKKGKARDKPLVLQPPHRPPFLPSNEASLLSAADDVFILMMEKHRKEGGLGRKRESGINFITITVTSI